VVGQSAEGGSGHSLLVVALQPARILAAKSHPGQNGRFAASGEGWVRPWDLAQPAQLRGLRWSTWRRFDRSSSPSANDTGSLISPPMNEPKNLTTKRGFSRVAAILETADLQYFRSETELFSRAAYFVFLV
jgi:hypothetical protein